MVIKLIDKLKDKNSLLIFLLFFGIANVFGFSTAYIAYQINPEFLNAGNFQNFSLVKQIVIALIFAPLLETLICQVMVIELLLKFFKQRYNLIVSIASALFALAHWYSLVYVLMIFFIGALFAVYYLVVKEKTKSKSSAYWALVLLHAVYNLMSFIPVFE